MKKLFFLIAASMFATSMWAQMEGDKLAINHEEFNNMPQYFQNISYNAATQTLSFTDTYQPSVSMKRLYEVHIYKRTALSDICALYSPWGKSPEQDQYNYSYGEWVDDAGHVTFLELELTGISRSKRSYETPSATTGGAVNWDISEAISGCYAEGATNIHISISGAYYKNEKYLYYESGQEDINYGYYEKNCLDINLTKINIFNVSTPTSTVKYSEALQIKCEIQASSNTLLTFLYYDAKASQYNEVYSYMLSAAEARQGKTVTYTKSFWDDDVEAERTYMVRAYVDGAFQQAKEVTINFKYPLVINSGTPTFYGAGETVEIAKNTCTEYTSRTLNNVPVSIDDLGSTCRLTMPACELWLTSKTKEFTVQFRDYDNTVLKTEKVSCGNDATPPTPPTHTGMAFVEWDKPYTNIQSNQVIRARYKYEGIEAELTCARTVAMQGEDVTFNVRVKTPTSIAVRAYLDGAWIDSEDDEVNFGSAVATADFTADEAVAGTTKSLAVTVSPTGSLNQGHHARYFRLRIQLYGSSTSYDFNIVRVDTYYPIVISGDAAVLSYLADGTRLTAGNGGTIYSRPQDTIYAVSGITACSLKFQWQSISQGVDAGDYWVVVPEESGANMLTISREKHTVVFYMSEYHNGYWENLYGAGAFEPQEIICGDAATPPDILPYIPEGKLFRGWKSRGIYADDAYTFVVRNMEFDALLEDEPQSIEEIPVPQEKARKVMYKGSLLIITPNGEVYNASGLRVK